MQQLSYYTLQALVSALRPRIGGLRLAESFSQQRDELVLHLASSERELFLRVGCHPQLPYLVPVEGFRRQRANVATLFQRAAGLPVLDLQLINGDRTVVLTLPEELQLVLKLHGSRSNVLLLERGAVFERFRNTLVEDASFVLPPDKHSSGHSPAASVEELRRAHPEVDRYGWAWVKGQIACEQSLQGAWEALLAQLSRGPYYVSRREGGADFWLLPPTEIPLTAHLEVRFYDRIEDALADWLRLALGRSSLAEETAAAQALLRQAIERAKAAQASARAGLALSQRVPTDEELGHLLLSQLDRVVPGADSVEVTDFFREGTFRIPLEPALSPQENARRFYARHKALQQRLAQLQRKLAQAEEALQSLEPLEPLLAAISSRKALQQLLSRSTHLLTPPKPAQDSSVLPYHRFRIGGYEVRVGKDARRNDLLTQQHAHKNDLWLHAKDAPGSHVVLRRQGEQNFPETVVEMAAGLAAWYSKRRSERWVPVAYTPRKFVRKTRHLAPGQVLLDREEVLLVAPLDPKTLEPDTH